MSDMLLLFTIGPVQSYIEQARKSQDLYAGSMILSHLCRTAITASKLPPEQIIFPKNSQSNREQSLPNRFTAIVRETDIVEQPGETLEARLKAFGESIEKAVKDTFMAIANTVSTPFQDQCPHGFMEQVQGYLNIHWLFLPCTEKEYAAIYPRLERLLKGVKQVHAFALEPEKGRKCSICGERNVKVYRKNEQEKKHSTEELAARKLFSSDVLVVDEKDFRLIQEKFLQPVEGICAVCYMKRSAELAFAKNEYEKDFPSTSHIALLDAIEKLPRQQRPTSPNTYPSDLVLILKDSETRARQNAQSAKEFNEAKRIYDALQEHNIPFCPYYALLHFDGDSMGKWLSEEHLQDQAQLESFHRCLSEKLAGFSEEARKYLQQPLGRAVYAGGDDFLGFVNLASLFEVLKHLRKQFDEQVTKPLFNGENAFVLTDDARLSFSAGVAVAHYKTPLGEVLKWARNMEKAAKAYDKDKDAFATAVLKHSGEIQQMTFKWRECSENEAIFWTTDLFHNIMKPVANGLFSSKFLKLIPTVFHRLLDSNKQLTPFWILKPEVRRLVTRACEMKNTQGVDPKDFQETKKKEIADLTEAVMEMYARCHENFENFAHGLEILDFFLRKDTA